jgi:hypothetical protein
MGTSSGPRRAPRPSRREDGACARAGPPRILLAAAGRLTPFSPAVQEHKPVITLRPRNCRPGRHSAGAEAPGAVSLTEELLDRCPRRPPPAARRPPPAARRPPPAARAGRPALGLTAGGYAASCGASRQTAGALPGRSPARGCHRVTRSTGRTTVCAVKRACRRRRPSRARTAVGRGCAARRTAARRRRRRPYTRSA